MPSRDDLFADYLKTIDDIQELILNNAEFNILPTIGAGENPNEIIVPKLVMDEPADYSKPICGSVSFVNEIVRFKHNITPQMIEKGFAYFVEFVNAFRHELEQQEVKPCQKPASE